MRGAVLLLALITCISSDSGPPPAIVLWSADMETGDMSQWYFPQTEAIGDHGGGEYNSGTAQVTAPPGVAHSGRYAAQLTISTAGAEVSGARLMRWAEPRATPRLWYSAWFYFPRAHAVAEWWNIFQWKSKREANGAVSNDPVFTLNVANGPRGEMFLYVRDHAAGRSHSPRERLHIPVGRWFRIEGLYHCAGDKSGRVTIWQDGVVLFDLPGVQTRYADGVCGWSVNNYSSGLTPHEATIYVDDVTISTGRVRSSAPASFRAVAR